MTLTRTEPFRARTVAQRRSVWQRLNADPAHGPLPALLVGLTALTGIVDAVSILALGRVFVANMTGNVVFAGFALAGAAGFALGASLAALAGFIAGAAVGGRLIRRLGHDRARLLAAGSALQLVLVAAALLLVIASGSALSPATRDVVAAVLAVGTGMQNAVVRRLAVPDMTTTVLTMTLTGIAADLRAGKPSAAFRRRLLAVATMLAGAVAGAELVLHDGPAAALGLATAVLALVTAAAARATRTPGAWRSATQPSPTGQPPVTTLGRPSADQPTPHVHHRQERRATMNVTILGSGNMGSAMAARLVDTGHRVTTWDRNADRAQQLAEIGVAVESDPRSAVAAASVVITMVTNGEAVHAIAEQMLPAMREDAVWVQASTVGAEWADRLRALADTHRRTMLDAPVSGSTDPARNGNLSWLVAGPTTAVDAARPVLDALGVRVLVVGTEQQASRLKLVVNTWMTAATVAMADVLAACDRLGIPRTALLEVIGDGPLAMPYAVQKARLMTEGNYVAGFPVELALKDVRLAKQAEGVQPPLVRAVEDRLQRAVDAGHARDDVAAVATVD
jgi:3-hydroxyisobutyrate dehydrogenase